MAKIRQTTLELRPKALSHNYNYLRSLLQPNTKFMGVVKAFAYGSDLIKTAKKIESLGADYLAVAYDSEGFQLRKAGIKLPILVFHPYPINYDELIRQRLIPSIFSKKNLMQFMETAQTFNVENYPIHLKLNTGMNRLGFEPEDLPFLKTSLATTNSIKVDGIFSHLAASEDKNETTFTQQQLTQFKTYSTAIIESLPYTPLRHLCNTSGVLNYPEAHFDMVRSGIGLYGFGNAPEFDKKLQPVAALKTYISQIHQLQKGDSVGYNRKFIASEAMKTATLPIGYADGIHRQYSNGKTAVIINKQKATIIGDVCMDMIMVDISHIDCQEGDEVCLFGRVQSAEEFAQTAGTISYELLAGITARVKRRIIEE